LSTGVGEHDRPESVKRRNPVKNERHTARYARPDGVGRTLTPRHSDGAMLPRDNRNPEGPAVVSASAFLSGNVPGGGHPAPLRPDWGCPQVMTWPPTWTKHGAQYHRPIGVPFRV
jgi:hypothetical protein